MIYGKPREVSSQDDKLTLFLVLQPPKMAGQAIHYASSGLRRASSLRRRPKIQADGRFFSSSTAMVPMSLIT